jgi:hypothetical protein
MVVDVITLTGINPQRKMSTRSLLCIGFLFVASAHADLQFVPRTAEYELDGIKFKQLAFSGGGEKDVTYSPPTGWDYSGTAAQLTLHPPNNAQAAAAIFKVPLSEPGSFDDAATKKLIGEALSSVPSGSTNAQLVSQEKNPVMIEGKETFLITITYRLYGENYSRSVLFLNRRKEQVRFQLTCPQADFNELQRAFLGSQFSWQNL